MLSYWKHNKFSILLIFIGILFYWSFAYQLERIDFVKMISLWTILFFISYKIIQSNPNNWKLLAVAGLLFRIVFLFAIPNLSQDFYRFIWDGRMLLEGYNPYLSLPEVWISDNNAPINQAHELYKGMGQLNGSHFTNYPPISQLCYLISAVFASKSILGSAMVFRILIILADIGTFFFGKKLLKALKLPEKQIFWYVLNPFIIIELTGNLHFEAVMVFFIIWSLYLLHKGYWYWAAIALGLSVSVKLIPLLFLPLFFKKFVIGDHKNYNKLGIRSGLPKLLGFYSIILLTVLVTFAPFLSEAFLINFRKTITLWFQNFEFNASIFYIIRWIGYQVVGWNIIETVGKILPMIVILILLSLTFIRKNKTTIQLITVLTLGICCYYFLSTTVHPWYIAVPLSLCIFTRYKFPIAWSFAIILSYTAYIHPDFKENLWMVGLEYFIVLTVFFWDMYLLSKNQTKSSLTSSLN
ncbi:mannosyltransferase [Aquimarina sp. AD10]|uniref:mannosyltransferase n=1 Tax=Aquimarina sp. AD10 TaxID=1714849 RepID=UPI000E4B2448|nr:mannosyltransferase [Aquimarina sp. AD10]AXT62514.1 mannosyltransferase [Aquimarina sp. AD10]RKM90294.1 mannosyltransferase [Aquimarina sp. AD10]